MSSDTNSLGTKTAIRSVRHNKQRNKNFHHRYLALCRSKNFQPLPVIVKPKQKDQVFLDVYGDRLKCYDWRLIADALREDNSINHLALRLRKTYTEGTDGLIPQNVMEGHGAEKSVFMDKRLFKQLVDTLAIFLRTNKVVEYFAIEGFPMAGVRLCTLITGLVDNTSLTELNLARCSIGDEGCKALCAEIKFAPNLLVLNLTACQLTVKGCQALAELIKFQKMQRYAASWEQSLRYGDIKEDKLMGLRYLYLSHNPAIGDYGLLELTDVLKDDAWIRQIHVCNCGLTDAGAQFLIECLHMNSAIEKFDIRENKNISNEACHEILVKLGVKFEEDGSDSSSTTKKSPKTLAGFREHCEYLEMQLNTERNRNNQLESKLEQMHLQNGDYAATIKELQHEMSDLTKSRIGLIEKLRKAENKSSKQKKAAGTPLRKSQSDAFATVFQGPTTSETAMASKSETVVNVENEPRHSSVASTNRVVERYIGDCGGDGVEKTVDSFPEKF
ncbi:protein Cep78 homolog [Anopheles marshallii]|uniref:protein Cep78 homolog n=1 Tax=Anopheles marshallii TaxID=1521116 RepID=UPI00237A41DC|nr:protein Cep78 homolog [Anopheles marshallii]